VKQFLKGINIQLPYDTAIPFLDIYLREIKRPGTLAHACNPSYSPVIPATWEVEIRTQLKASPKKS
jgi:hypothetical protein